MRQNVPTPARLLSRLRRDDDGVTAVEVLIALPVILGLMIFSYELGLALVRHTLLERATDVVVRDIRIGKIEADDYDTIRDNICYNAKIIPDCENRLKLELKVTDPYADWTGMDQALDCAQLSEVEVEGAIQVVADAGDARRFDTAWGNQLVLLRSCVSIQPFSANGVLARAMTSDQPRDEPLAYNLTSVTSYVMEP